MAGGLDRLVMCDGSWMVHRVMDTGLLSALSAG